MGRSIREVMTPDPVTLSADRSVLDAAKEMKNRDIGDVIVLDQEGGDICGIVTDRDIVVRVLAEGKDPGSTRLRECCSQDLTTLPLDGSIKDAVEVMRERAIRRVPVVDDGKPVGIISIGDLAVETDERSALADISAAPPNN